MSRKSESLVPLHLNPVRRYRKQLGLTLAAAAKEAGVNHMTWYLVERGCTTSLPVGIVAMLSNSQLEVDGGILSEEYEDFQHIVRHAFSETYLDDLLTTLEKGPYTSCKGLVRAICEDLGLSQSGLAKALCLPRSAITGMASGGYKKIPSYVLDVLFEIRVNPDVLMRNLGKLL